MITPPDGVSLEQYWLIVKIARWAEEILLDDHIKVTGARLDKVLRDKFNDLDNSETELLFIETAQHKALSEDILIEVALEYLGY